MNLVAPLIPTKQDAPAAHILVLMAAAEQENVVLPVHLLPVQIITLAQEMEIVALTPVPVKDTTLHNPVDRHAQQPPSAVKPVIITARHLKLLSQVAPELVQSEPVVLQASLAMAAMD